MFLRRRREEQASLNELQRWMRDAEVSTLFPRLLPEPSVLRFAFNAAKSSNSKLVFTRGGRGRMQECMASNWSLVLDRRGLSSNLFARACLVVTATAEPWQSTK